MVCQLICAVVNKSTGYRKKTDLKKEKTFCVETNGEI